MNVFEDMATEQETCPVAKAGASRHDPRPGASADWRAMGSAASPAVPPNSAARVLGAAVMSAFALFSTGALAADALPAGPMDLTVVVTESLGNDIRFEDNRTVHALPTDPLQSVDLLHLSDLGFNGSGRSTQITQAFGSALARSDASGGVGVSIVADHGLGNKHELIATSTFTQTFSYSGTVDSPVQMELRIPRIEVGLLGVPPFTSAFRFTESAQATAELRTTILHADGTSQEGRFFQFGLRLTETQVELAPGTFANFAELKPLFVNVPLANVALQSSGSDSDPRFSLDQVKLAPDVGTLRPGDTLTVIYSLTAFETTVGGEGKGAFAFLGDPFSISADGPSLVPLLTPSAVPEPASGALLLVGLGWLGWRRLGRPRHGDSADLDCE